jgi:hypothetical protein
MGKAWQMGCAIVLTFAVSPLQPLTQRLLVVVLGVVTLVASNEVSKFYEWLSTKGWSLV